MNTPSGIGGKSCQDRGSPCWPPKCSNSHKLLIQLPIRLIKIAHSMGKNCSLFYICRMCNANPQYCCVFIGVVAILSGFIEGGYKVYQLATLSLSYMALGMVVAWVLIIMAAVLLILGAIKKIRFLLLIWIIVSLVCGVALIILKTVIYACYFSYNPDIAYHIFGASYIIFITVFIPVLPICV
nr:uncharacterized protein LOC108018766 isoform X3 [Drosophila suzukii]